MICPNDPRVATFLRDLDTDPLQTAIALLDALRVAHARIDNLEQQVACQARMIDAYHALAFGQTGDQA